MTTTLRLPAPHKGQRRVFRALRRFNWLAFGRRWRKTTGSLTLAHTGFDAGAHHYRGLLDGATVLWGAPTYDQCRVGWGECERIAGGSVTFRASRMEIEYPTGGRLIFRSLDNPDNARGHTADGVIIDEAGFTAERAWYDVLRPMISDTHGWAIIGGTPKGHNWFWREHMAAPGLADSAAFQGPTLGVRSTAQGLVREPHPLENPTFPFAEAERMWRTMPQRIFEQEFLAQFTEDGGGVFRGVVKAATLEPAQPYSGQFVFGVDWGKSNDWTVITVWDVARKALVALDRFNQIGYNVQGARVAEMYRRWHPTVIIAENNSMGQAMIDFLRPYNINFSEFVTNNATKQAAIEGLALGIERGDVSLVNDAALVSELQAFEMDRLPSGLLRYGAPEGMHDDCVMAAAIGYSGVMDSGPLLLWGDP